VTLVPVPALPNFAGLDLSPLQTTSLTNAAYRMADVDAPLPESVRQDTAGTVHLVWFLLGCRIIVTLASSGRIDTAVTTERAPGGNLGKIVAFQVQLQEFFAL
jgi:hypothetical protein